MILKMINLLLLGIIIKLHKNLIGVEDDSKKIKKIKNSFFMLMILRKVFWGLIYYFLKFMMILEAI